MPDTSLLFGPFLLGACFNMILYGVCVVQSFIYYQTYQRDPKGIRYLVLYLFIAETINAACNIGLLYEPLVLNYGDPKSFTTSPKMLVADAIVTVMISTPVQLFIAWRLKIISGSPIIPLIIAALGVCSLVGGTKLSISVAIVREYRRFKEFEPSVIVWLASSAAADLLITGALSWSLVTRKSGFKKTDDKIGRILRLTIQTGLITMLFALADLVVFVTHSNTTLNFIPDFTLSKLYTNSLLSTLNARAGWENLAGQTQEVNVLFQRGELSDMRNRQTVNGAARMGPTRSLNPGSEAIELQVHSTRNQSHDHGNKPVISVIENLQDTVYETPAKGWKLNNSYV